MSVIYTRKETLDPYTLISNRFIDFYMPEANGEFVKVYLYLLRVISGGTSDFSLFAIADHLDCTEKDIERALKYWCKKEILRLEYDDQKHIIGIVFLPLADHETEIQPSIKPKMKPEKTPPLSSGTSKEEPVALDASDLPKLLTPSRVKELKSREDIVQLLFIAEQYLGKTLSSTETSRILYFYEELHFSADLIEYLIEYCVSKGSKSIRYIEKVALSWHESGVTTPEMAKRESNRYHKNYFTVLKAFGISNRNPVESEVEAIDRWIKEYGFSLDLISEACNRTILQTGKPSFAYAEQILASWSKKEVRSLTDVIQLDTLHKTKTTEKTSSAPKVKAINRFNNFPQRKYDFPNLEKQLLK
ncbi:DNA replication protein DnaD [Bacteroidia bacterium]|nr:DNA replication protein DnaD [Bacteroidia bacterium]